MKKRTAKVELLDLSSDEIFSVSRFLDDKEVGKSLLTVCKKVYYVVITDLFWEFRAKKIPLSKKNLLSWFETFKDYMNNEGGYLERFKKLDFKSVNRLLFKFQHFKHEDLQEAGFILNVENERYVGEEKDEEKNKTKDDDVGYVKEEPDAVVKDVEITPILDACIASIMKEREMPFKRRGDFREEEEKPRFDVWKEYSKEEMKDIMEECLQKKEYKRFDVIDGKFTMLEPKKFSYHRMWGYCLGCVNNRSYRYLEEGKEVEFLFGSTEIQKQKMKELNELYIIECEKVIELMTDEVYDQENAKFFFSGVGDYDMDRIEACIVYLPQSCYVLFLYYSRYWG